MALQKPHSDWRLPQASPVDVRAVDPLDKILARLWLRVSFDNLPLMARPGAETVTELADQMEHSPHFRDFGSNPGAAEAWLRADLVKTLRRKDPNKFTVGRPVHALATRVRSVDRETNDSGVSLAVYSWLKRVAPELVGELREFITVETSDESLDLASRALALLGTEQSADAPKSDEPEKIASPSCLGVPKTYADDVARLLAYREVMPRSALVDHLRRLTGFHVGLYLLRAFRIAAVAERRDNDERACSSCPARVPRSFGCPYRLDLLVDFGEDARSSVAKLAEVSWAGQEDHLHRYVRSHLALKKLDEFATYLDESYPDERVAHDSLDEIAAVESAVREDLLQLYFDKRIRDLLEEAKGETRGRFEDLQRQYRGMGLSSFRTYVGLLAHDSEQRWFRYHRYLLDSLFGKNSAQGLLRQPLGGRRRRRAAMGAALLETLTLIAVVGGDASGFFTRPLRVDELIDRLEVRYGLLVSRPPAGLENDVTATRTVASNVDRFKARLRETGLYTDLSDAFLAQLVRPRYPLDSAA